MRIALALLVMLGFSGPAWTAPDSQLMLCTVVAASPGSSDADKARIGNRMLLGADPTSSVIVKLQLSGIGYHTPCEISGPLMVCDSFRPELKDVLDYETGKLVEARDNGQFIESKCVPYSIEAQP